MKPKCKIEGCENTSDTKELCPAHYMRLLRYGDPLKGGIMRAPKNSLGHCKIEGCKKNAVGLELCCTHYSKLKKYGDPLAGRINDGGTCKVDKCLEPVKSFKLCCKHYARFKKNGITTVEKWQQNGQTKAWHIDTRGYVVKYDPKNEHARGSGFVAQHREVMGIKIGRKLLKGENVHHLNGIRSDNRIENLELWAVNQPYGQRVKDLLAWADEINRIYKPIADKL